jgi:hypothetical protein
MPQHGGNWRQCGYGITLGLGVKHVTDALTMLIKGGRAIGAQALTYRAHRTNLWKEPNHEPPTGQHQISVTILLVCIYAT